MYKKEKKAPMNPVATIRIQKILVESLLADAM